jgi:competence protein ComEA
MTSHPERDHVASRSEPDRGAGWSGGPLDGGADGLAPDGPSFGDGVETAPARQRWSGWVRPTPAEVVGLALMVLGSLVATVLWWAQSVTGPDGLEGVRAVGAAVSPDGHAHGPAPGVVLDPGVGLDPDVVPDPGGRSTTDPGAPLPGDPGPTDAAVTVHVSGAVARPGLVTLPTGGRVGEAVIAAGGLTRDADPDRINLARLLVDGEHVHLPRVGEDGGILAGPPAPGGTSDGAGAGGAGGTTPDGLVDLNRATATELEQLPGIGPARAAAIIEYRELHGPFAVPGDLRGVSGIGEATFQKLAPLVVVR